jgi:hypothetical protein
MDIFNVKYVINTDASVSLIISRLAETRAEQYYGALHWAKTVGNCNSFIMIAVTVRKQIDLHTILILLIVINYGKTSFPI